MAAMQFGCVSVHRVNANDPSVLDPFAYASKQLRGRLTAFFRTGVKPGQGWMVLHPDIIGKRILVTGGLTVSGESIPNAFIFVPPVSVEFLLRCEELYPSCWFMSSEDGVRITNMLIGVGTEVC